MDEALRTIAEHVRASLSCSIELPAGAGKTQLVAALAAIAAESQARPLILTHTNAGVDVLRRRLRRFGVGGAAARVDTLASWSFELIRHYPELSGVLVPPEPDWHQSPDYYQGASRAMAATAIQRVMRASYAFVIVDEYQDCVLEQHRLMLALGEILPICVIGDPLQSIFNFKGNVTVTWRDDVVSTWSALDVPSKPWRWHGRNEPLGRWLLDIRSDLSAGRLIDLDGAPLQWFRSQSPQAPVQACLAKATLTGSVAAIDKWPSTCTTIAARTNGAFGVMEELEGRFMMDFAAVVDRGDPKQIPSATLQFAKDCLAKISEGKLDSTVMSKLKQGKPVSHLKRPGAESALIMLSALLADSSPPRVLEALQELGRIEGGRLYRREAWRDMLKAIAVAGAGGEITVCQALVRLRNRTRIIGRVAERRIISRPLLIKGLEYDHAIVLNPERLTATELYVALSRGRDSLTVVSEKRYIRPARS